MKWNKKRLIGLLTLLVGLVVVLSSCSPGDNFKDVKGVKNHLPDAIMNIENVDGHPNIIVLCIRGAAFYTTTRDYKAIQEKPSWDHLCPVNNTPIDLAPGSLR